MKTLAKFLVIAAVTGAAVSYAGPGPQFSQNRPASKPQPTKAEPTPSAVVADSSTLTCSHMVVPNDGRGFSKSLTMTVRCTPQMLKTDWRCQQACAARAKK